MDIVYCNEGYLGVVEEIPINSGLS